MKSLLLKYQPLLVKKDLALNCLKVIVTKSPMKALLATSLMKQLLAKKPMKAALNPSQSIYMVSNQSTSWVMSSPRLAPMTMAAVGMTTVVVGKVTSQKIMLICQKTLSARLERARISNRSGQHQPHPLRRF